MALSELLLRGLSFSDSPISPSLFGPLFSVGSSSSVPRSLRFIPTFSDFQSAFHHQCCLRRFKDRFRDAQNQTYACRPMYCLVKRYPELLKRLLQAIHCHVDVNIKLSVIFSKRQRITLRLLYAIAIPSVVCLSSVTLVHPTQAVELFGNFFSPYDSPGTFLVPKIVGGGRPFPL